MKIEKIQKIWEIVQETFLPISFQISNETVYDSDKLNVNALKKKL